MAMDKQDRFYKYLGVDDDGKAVIRMLRLKEMLRRTGIGKSTAYDWMNPESPRYDPTFPRSIKLSEGRKRSAVGWLESDINRWIESRVSAEDLYDGTAAATATLYHYKDGFEAFVGGIK